MWYVCVNNTNISVNNEFYIVFSTFSDVFKCPNELKIIILSLLASSNIFTLIYQRKSSKGISMLDSSNASIRTCLGGDKLSSVITTIKMYVLSV